MRSLLKLTGLVTTTALGAKAVNSQKEDFTKDELNEYFTPVRGPYVVRSLSQHEVFNNLSQEVKSNVVSASLINFNERESGKNGATFHRFNLAKEHTGDIKVYQITKRDGNTDGADLLNLTTRSKKETLKTRGPLSSEQSEKAIDAVTSKYKERLSINTMNEIVLDLNKDSHFYDEGCPMISSETSLASKALRKFGKQNEEQTAMFTADVNNIRKNEGLPSCLIYFNGELHKAKDPSKVQELLNKKAGIIHQDVGIKI